MAFNKTFLFEKAAFVLKEAEKLGASQAEVIATLSEGALTRLANSIIDQNVAEKHAQFSIIVYQGKKKGSTTVEVIDDASLKAAVADAVKVAKISPENKDFQSIPEPRPLNPIPLEELVYKTTLNTTPEQRAKLAMVAVESAHAIDKRIKAVAGAISHGFTEKVVANSLGVEAYAASTYSNVNLTVLAEDGTEQTAGWSADNNRDFSKLHVATVAEKAARKAAESFGMRFLEPSEYEVILEPAAVAGFMFFMSYFGFSATMYQDYISFLRDKIGEKLFSEKFTMWDDAFDPRIPYRSFFDDEGQPKKALELVNQGVVKNLAYDSLTATKDGVTTTGHNAKFRGRSIPIASHILVEEGDSSLEEMIAETKNGILVTHFHYQNVVNPTKGIFTGLTRDGTWYVKDGEIQYPLRTLRYTDSVLRFLGSIDLIGKYSELNDSQLKVPAMKLPSFRISGSQKE